MRRQTIGFDRDIDIRWMDAVAGWAAAGEAPEDLRAFVWRMLEGDVAGTTPHSGRGKTATVLMRIWGEAPPELEPLRSRALHIITSGTPHERLGAHWAMSMARYPFFTDVAATTGRLLALQGQASLAQVTRRLVEGWGERSTMTRAVQRVIRSVVRWRLLRDTEQAGVYIGPAERIAARGAISGLLLEAAIHSGHARDLSLTALLRHPALFPFSVHTTPRELAAGGLLVHRVGVDSDVVAPRRVPSHTRY